MKRIDEFEKMLIEKVSRLEKQDVTVADFTRFLSSDGEIHYRYESILFGCDISTSYKGFRYYGNNPMCIKLDFRH